MCVRVFQRARARHVIASLPREKRRALGESDGEEIACASLERAVTPRDFSSRAVVTRETNMSWDPRAHRIVHPPKFIFDSRGIDSNRRIDSFLAFITIYRCECIPRRTRDCGKSHRRRITTDYSRASSPSDEDYESRAARNITRMRLQETHNGEHSLARSFALLTIIRRSCRAPSWVDGKHVPAHAVNGLPRFLPTRVVSYPTWLRGSITDSR